MNGDVRLSQKKVSAIIYAVLVLACVFLLGYLIGQNHVAKEIQVNIAAQVQLQTVAANPPAQYGRELIDLNTAQQWQLQTLPGIGEELSERIIAYREKIGGFTEKTQIMEVEGIGEKIYLRIEQFITVGGTP